MNHARQSGPAISFAGVTKRYGSVLIPDSQLPSGLRHAAAVLPSRRLADLARAVAAGHNPPLVAVAVLAAWTLAAAGAALALRRRDGGA